MALTQKLSLFEKHFWYQHTLAFSKNDVFRKGGTLRYSKIKSEQIINTQRFHLDSFYSLQTEVNKTLTINKQHLTKQTNKQTNKHKQTNKQ